MDLYDSLRPDADNLKLKRFSLSQLPKGVTDKGIDFHNKNALYGYLSQELITDLSAFLKGKNVLEAYAGRGHLSSALSQKGIKVNSTSLQQGHDASSSLGYVFPVERLDVVSAVEKYRDWMDVLLVNWPTTDYGMEKCLNVLPDKALIVFIGEVTDYTATPPFLGGCATDAFFERVIELPELSDKIRYPAPRRDKVKVYRKRLT